jgi:hypothetical protein
MTSGKRISHLTPGDVAAESAGCVERTFLLSPASTAGKRAQLLLRKEAAFDLARRVRSAEGATLGEVFSFLSGLYFRGKLTYARAFSASSGQIWVITAGRGLMNPDSPIRADDLKQFVQQPIDLSSAAYCEPLARDAQRVGEQASPGTKFVLLGSVASNKYTSVLLPAFGERLVFPRAFVGRGDMSRGGLLLRAVDEGHELEYVPIEGSVLRGRRPAKLTPRR